MYGSPVLKNGVFTGIISYGISYNTSFSPVVAINVTSYLTFIEQVQDRIRYQNAGYVKKLLIILVRVSEGIFQSITIFFQKIIKF